MLRVRYEGGWVSVATKSGKPMLELIQDAPVQQQPAASAAPMQPQPGPPPGPPPVQQQEAAVAAADSQMVQVQCPPGCAPGMQVQVSINGQTVLVTIPAGVQPGGTFMVQAPAH